MGQCIYTQTPPRWNVKNRCSRKAFCLVRQSLWASALDVCPFPHQIHLLPCPHSAQCPQRQNSVDHTNGLLGALVLATGSSGGCGREGGEWGQRAGVGSSLLGGHSSCWALLAQVSHNCSVPSPHQPQSHSLESCTTPLVPLEPGHTSAKSFSLDFPQIAFIWICPLFLPGYPVCLKPLCAQTQISLQHSF